MTLIHHKDQRVFLGTSTPNIHLSANRYNRHLTTRNLSLMHLSNLDLVSILVAQHVVAALAIGFTKPGSLLRAISLPFSIGLGWLSIASAKSSRDSITRILAMLPPAVMLHHFTVVLLRRFDFDFAGPQPRDVGKKQSRSPLPDTTWHRFTFGLAAATSRRYCGRSFEVDNVPRFRKEDPTFVPPRRRFLIDRGLLYLALYLFIDCLENLAPRNHPRTSESSLDLSDGVDVSMLYSPIGRVVLVLMMWGVGLGFTTIIFGLPGYLLVLLGLSEPKHWRPIANLDHGIPFSIRRFWR